MTTPEDDKAGPKAEGKTLAGLLGSIRERPPEKAPGDLLADIQRDIQQRSGGRYYGYHWKARFPFEALATAILLVVALIIYVFARPESPPLVPVDARTFLVSGSDLGVGARILTDYGSFKPEPGPTADGWVHVVGEVAAERMEALRAELSLYPSMRIDLEEDRGASVLVHVAIKK